MRDANRRAVPVSIPREAYASRAETATATTDASAAATTATTAPRATEGATARLTRHARGRARAGKTASRAHGGVVCGGDRAEGGAVSGGAEDGLGRGPGGGRGSGEGGGSGGVRESAHEAAPEATWAAMRATRRRASRAISAAEGRGTWGETQREGVKPWGKRWGARARAAQRSWLPGDAKIPQGSTPPAATWSGAGEGRRSAVDASDTGSCIAANASAREPRVAHSEGLKIAAIRLDTPRTRATARYARAKSAESADDQTCAPTRRQACISATSRVYHA